MQNVKNILAMILMMALLAACQTTGTVKKDPCPMPGGYILKDAVATAEQTLTNCPGKFDRVFLKLVEIGKHKPAEENGPVIRDLLKRLVQRNLVAEDYARKRYGQYFDHRFDLPDVKTYNLPGRVDDIKARMRGELAKKKIGLKACCGDEAGYALAESEFSRVVNFMDNIVLNVEYFHGDRNSGW